MSGPLRNRKNIVNTSSATPANPATAAATRRAGWMRVLTRWHWISSAIALVGMLFFSATGITLNHADLLESSTHTTLTREAVLPATVLAALDAGEQAAPEALPDALSGWLRQNWQMGVSPKGIEWSADELYIDLKRPGVDASLTIDRHSGEISYDATDRGWVAWLNELHRGRNAGSVWHAFITVFGIASLVFAITGLLLLHLHAGRRWLTWPLTALGLVVPLLLILLFIH